MKKHSFTTLILSLTLLHFTGDLYISFIGPLLPVFQKKFSLSLVEVGWITAISQLLALVVQPISGYVADRVQNRVFILGGMLISAIFIPATGIVTSYWLVLVCVAIGAIGASLFHPPVVGMIVENATTRYAFAMSIFNMGGTLSFGIGPMLVAAIVGAWGLSFLPVTAVFGVLVFIILLGIIPRPKPSELKNMGFVETLKEVFGKGIWQYILILWVILVSRAFVFQSFLTFLPLYYTEKGFSLVSVGGVISMLAVSGALSGLLAGLWADRFGYRKLFYMAHIATPICAWFLLSVSGMWIYLGAFLFGFFVLSIVPLGIAMAQLIVGNKGRSMVASLTMGLAMCAGGMMTPMTGWFADMYTLRPVLLAVCIVPVIMLLFIMQLPEPNQT